MNDALSPEQERQLAARFTVLVARYGELLRRYLLGLTRRSEVADDLCQQLWLRLYEAARAGRFLPEDEDGFRGYLFTAARNLHLDECVRRHSVSRTATLDPRALESLARIGGGGRRVADRGRAGPQQRRPAGAHGACPVAGSAARHVAVVDGRLEHRGDGGPDPGAPRHRPQPQEVRYAPAAHHARGAGPARRDGRPRRTLVARAAGRSPR